MRIVGFALVVGACLATPPALALTAATNNYCAPASAGNFGIADEIDGTGGNAIGSGSIAPYNLDMFDGALVCVDNHMKTATVDTAIEFVNEIANTISHELGHLLGLEHADGTAESLMNAGYDGIDKGFTTAAEQAVLNDASQHAVQVVWLDFDALQAALLAVYEPFSQAGVLESFGIGAGQVAATIASIFGNVQGDYLGPWTGGASYDFYTLEIDALNATAGVGNYSTISIVAIPEPGTAGLLLSGLAVMGRLYRRRLD